MCYNVVNNLNVRREHVTIYRNTTDMDTSTEMVLVIEGMEEETAWVNGDYRDGSASDVGAEFARLQQSAEIVNRELDLTTAVYVLEHFHAVEDGADCDCAQWAQSHLPEIEFLSDNEYYAV